MYRFPQVVFDSKRYAHNALSRPSVGRVMPQRVLFRQMRPQGNVLCVSFSRPMGPCAVKNPPNVLACKKRCCTWRHLLHDTRRHPSGPLGRPQHGRSIGGIGSLSVSLARRQVRTNKAHGFDEIDPRACADARACVGECHRCARGCRGCAWLCVGMREWWVRRVSWLQPLQAVARGSSSGATSEISGLPAADPRWD